MSVSSPYVCGQCRKDNPKANWNNPCPHWREHEMREVLIACDSELSAIAHGRPPSSKDELKALYHRCRALYAG